MLDNTQTLANLLDQSGVRLYRHESTNAASNAQQNLQGRTHYADPETLRWHKARILSARDIWCGAGFMVVESVSLDWDNTKRGYRFAVFDVFGTVIERADLEHTWKTSDGAHKAFWKWLETFDPFTYYADALQARAARLDKESARLSNAAFAINNPSIISEAA
jgi:hypothetical protein